MLDDDGLYSQVRTISLVPGASRARPLGELRHPRHDQRPRPLVQRGVVGVLPQPGRLDGSKKSGRESHGEQQKCEDYSSQLGRHGGRDRG